MSPGERWNVMWVPASRASALARVTSSSDIRSWPTSVTHPWTRAWPRATSSTNRWRSSTSSTDPGERRVGDVPAPRPERAADPDGVVGREHPVGVGDGAGLDRERDPVGHRLDQAERGRELVVVAGVGGMDRHRPLEDGVPGVDVVGDRRAHQAIAGEVLVGVDQARHHEVAGPAEPLGIRRLRRQLGGRADGDDAVAVDEHAAVGDHPAVGVHREDDVPEHEQHGRMV